MLSIKMADSIKLFQLNRKSCELIGIYVPQTEKDRHKRNSINLTFVICLTQFAITLVAFLLYDANSMSDYGAACYTLFTVLGSTIAYLIFVWKMNEILTFVANCELFIGKSKLHC